MTDQLLETFPARDGADQLAERESRRVTIKVLAAKKSEAVLLASFGLWALLIWFFSESVTEAIFPLLTKIRAPGEYSTSEGYIENVRGIAILLGIKLPIPLVVGWIFRSHVVRWASRVRQAPRSLLLILGFAALLQALTVFTFSPIVAGDGASYFKIAEGMSGFDFNSHLAFSTGYPFVFSFLLVWDGYGPIDQYIIIVAQKALFVGEVYLIYRIFISTTNRNVAIAASAIFALSPAFFDMTSHTRPMAFLAPILLFMVYESACKKNPSWLLLALAGGIGLLVRPVIWPVVVVGLIVYYLRVRKMQQALLATCLTGFVFGAYILVVHWPSTGTPKYSYVAGTNLHQHLAMAGILPRAEYGKSSVELLTYLAAELPNPPEELWGSKGWFKLRYDGPRPEIDLTPVDSPNVDTLHQLHYAIGHSKADSLLLKSSLSAIMHNPARYLRSIASTGLGSMESVAAYPNFPTRSDLTILNSTFMGFKRAYAAEGGRHFGQDSRLLFWPGVALVELLNTPTRFSKWFWLLGGIILPSFTLLWVNRQRFMVGVVLAASLGYIVSTFAFAPAPLSRYIEPILPLLFLNAGIALFVVLSLGHSITVRSRRLYRTRFTSA